MTEPIARARDFSYRYPGEDASPPALHRRVVRARAAAASPFSPGSRARASRPSCARSAASCPTSTAVRPAASSRSAASTCASTARVSWRRSAERSSRSPSRRWCWAGCAPSSSCRSSTAASRRRRWLAPWRRPRCRWRRPSARSPDRDAVGRRAAARGSGRGDGPRAAAAAARRADLAARPGGRRRADLPPSPAQRGLGHRGGGGRAPTRALPVVGRPGDRARRRRHRPRRDTRGPPGLGQRGHARVGHPGGPPVLPRRPSRSPGVGQAGARRPARGGRGPSPRSGGERAGQRERAAAAAARALTKDPVRPRVARTLVRDLRRAHRSQRRRPARSARASAWR